jgi:hypothetical protein
MSSGHDLRKAHAEVVSRFWWKREMAHSSGW